jgi:hypothetical protein
MLKIFLVFGTIHTLQLSLKLFKYQFKKRGLDFLSNPLFNIIKETYPREDVGMAKYLIRNVSHLIPGVDEKGVSVQLGTKTLRPGEVVVTFNIDEATRRIEKKRLKDNVSKFEYSIITIEEINYTIGTRDELSKIEKLASQALKEEKETIVFKHLKTEQEKKDFATHQMKIAIKEYEESKKTDETIWKTNIQGSKKLKRKRVRVING